jgi:CheY-like chemotaxis protein
MSRSHRPKSILLVDDDPDILFFLQTLLEWEGYRVHTVNNDSFVEHLQPDALPDLIMLDMLMSGIDGRELAQQLKRDGMTAHIPLLMISAHPSAEQEAYAAGADAFVAKPFEMNVLLAKVANSLAEKSESNLS